MNTELWQWKYNIMVMGIKEKLKFEINSDRFANIAIDSMVDL